MRLLPVIGDSAQRVAALFDDVELAEELTSHVVVGHGRNKLGTTYVRVRPTSRSQKRAHLSEIVCIPKVDGADGALSNQLEGRHVRRAVERLRGGVEPHGPLRRLRGRRCGGIDTRNEFLGRVCVGSAAGTSSYSELSSKNSFCSKKILTGSHR